MVRRFWHFATIGANRHVPRATSSVVRGFAYAVRTGPPRRVTLRTVLAATIGEVTTSERSKEQS